MDKRRRVLQTLVLAFVSAVSITSPAFADFELHNVPLGPPPAIEASAHFTPLPSPPNVRIPRPVSTLGFQAIDSLKHLEGFRADPYKDFSQMSIGYGTDAAKAERLYGANGITEQQATLLLEADVAEVEEVVRSLVTVKISQNQYDAIVLFAYNVGTTAFAKSTLRRELNSGNLAKAANEFLRWNRVTQGGQKIVVAGLTKRRGIERSLFLG